VSEKKRFYSVAKGRTPGIYTRWFGPGGAQEQVMGFAGALYRGFATMEEAREFLNHPRQPQRKSPLPRQERGDGTAPEGTERPVHVYTDGGCFDNPGPGGYGVVIIEGGSRREISGGYRLTTNNRMELMACIVALRSLRPGSHAVLHTDSRYVADAVEKGWAVRWRSRNWMRDKGHMALNSDLWADLLGALEGHDVVFKWVRGHAGNPENERCDVLAKKAAQGTELQDDPGYENARRNGAEKGLFEEG
jgi:ribonuclease HI